MNPIIKPELKIVSRRSKRMRLAFLALAVLLSSALPAADLPKLRVLILSGRAEVVKSDGSDRASLLATLGVGEPFGELALLGEWKRTATVRAIEETTCLGMDRWVFLAHLQRQPAMAVKMLQFVTQRLVDTDARLGAG